MKLAFLADPLPTFKIYKDSTYAMMKEATRRNHQLYAFQQQDMALDQGQVIAQVCGIDLLTGSSNNHVNDIDSEPHPDSSLWYQASAPVLCALSEFDAVILRKDPPFNMEYIYTTYLLERAEAQGAQVLNKPAAVRNHNEKFAITEFPDFMTPTLVTSDMQRLRAFHQQHQNIILKPLDGMGGSGVFRVKPDGLNLGAIAEVLTRNGATTIMAQRFIPEISQGDKRILLIGGEVVPYCLARIPQAGEVRGNLAAGGQGVAQPLSQRDFEVARFLAPLLLKRGLLLVGLDMIGDYMTELNVTSPTCFQEITRQTGFDVAAMFIDAVENSVKKHAA